MSASKRVHLNLAEKSLVLDQLNNGKSHEEVAKKFKVSRAAVYGIQKKSGLIKDAILSGTNDKRKTLKPGLFQNVESALFQWFLQRRATHTPVSNDMMIIKGKEFNEKMNGANTFVASIGWLQNFKKRFGIRQLKICGEKLSSDNEAVDPFKEKLHDIIRQKGRKISI